jgi:hypothetical protein
MERLPEGNRRAALDVLSEIRPEKAAIVKRVSKWNQLSTKLSQRITPRLNQRSAIGRALRSRQSV